MMMCLVVARRRPFARCAAMSAAVTVSLSTRLRSYEETVAALNALQSNVQVLEAISKQGSSNEASKLKQTVEYLENSGLTMQQLDTIPLIHVAGTKGKGSSCAFTESILRHYGLRTGFFSSPHLISVTERIRLDGRPISKAKFIQYFWPVYERLVHLYSDPLSRPSYFRFLTILAMHIFYQEKVDVAIVEVGIGGMYDCTNIIRHPVVCGISTLDLDHVSVLGNTMEQIAWQKAGIMKPETPTFIDGDHSLSVLSVMAARAKEVGCDVKAVPDLSRYDWGPFPPNRLGLYSGVHHKNASLALQLANCFLLSRQLRPPREVVPETVSSCAEICIPTAPAFKLDEPEALGLSRCCWPGRHHIIQRDPFHYFLDGAHTKISIEACRKWFEQISGIRPGVYRVLIFNTTKDRDFESLLSLLVPFPFDLVLFCTNLTRGSNNPDCTSVTTSFNKDMIRVQDHAATWLRLQGHTNCLTLPYCDDALRHAHEAGVQSAASTVHILVTGSLHLVGGVLSYVDPAILTKMEAGLVNEPE